MAHGLYNGAVISDLHMRAGKVDDFLFDVQFENMLSDLWHDGVRELVFNGDVFDFVCVGDDPAHPDPELGFTEDESVARLDAIAAAHPLVIESLRRFISKGGRCVFIPGNHDWEIHWPRVQQRLIKLLGNPDKLQLDFVLYGAPYRPVRSVLIEHGHQRVRDQNRFKRPRHPIIQDPLGGPARTEQTLGGFMLRTLVNPIEQLYPFINNIKPLSKVDWMGGKPHLLNIAAIARSFAGHVWSGGRTRGFFRWVSGLIGFQQNMLLPTAMLSGQPVPMDFMAMLADELAEPTQLAAQRVMRLRRNVKFVVFGHSHELVDHNHRVNRNKKGRLYLNPGSWNPCRNLLDQPGDVSLDSLCEGADYKYQLAFVRFHGARDRLSARCTVYDQGHVWLAA